MYLLRNVSPQDPSSAEVVTPYEPAVRDGTSPASVSDLTLLL